MLKDNIKAIRKSKGLSQEELAIKLNVVRQTISKWEQGLSVPDSEILPKGSVSGPSRTPAGTAGKRVCPETGILPGSPVLHGRGTSRHGTVPPPRWFGPSHRHPWLPAAAAGSAAADSVLRETVPGTPPGSAALWEGWRYDPSPYHC